MKETFYFSHDYNASQDPKIMLLLNNCGLSGLAMYWILIEILHQQPDNKISREAYSGYIDFYGKKDGDNEHLLSKIEQELINTKLLIEQDNYITSNRVLENKKQREILSEKRSLAGKKGAYIRINKASAKQVKANAKQGKERKGKERKLNNNIILQPVGCGYSLTTENNLTVKFDFDLIRSKMTSSNDKRMHIIEAYWNYKSIVFENKEQYVAGLRRELRCAGLLTGYSLERIKEVMFFLNGEDFLSEKWTLETVHKYIDRNLDNIK